MELKFNDLIKIFIIFVQFYENTCIGRNVKKEFS